MKKILIVEDNHDVRDNLAEILSLSGYQAFTAENGKKGVELAIKESPDLILCDVMMPELDGFGVLHILSKNPMTQQIPFIFLTAKAEKDDFRRGMNLGADDYITKPFDDEELLQAIEMRLQKKSSAPTAVAPSRGLSDEERGYETLKSLVEKYETRIYRKKDTLFEEGSYPKVVYYVQKGKVKIFKSNEDGKDFIIHIATVGDFVGYLSLLRNSPYYESASILEEAELSIIPKDEFVNLVLQDGDVAKKVMKVLAQNITNQEEMLVKLAYNSVRKRVAEALVKLQNTYNPKGEQKGFPIMREDLASMVGTAKETVIRVLTDFKDEKLISIEDRLVTVLNYNKLDQLPN